MRLLFAENNEPLAEILKRTLEKDGFAVDLVRDGETAERRATAFEHTYDIILLDMLLPEKDGLEVCVSLRSHAVKTPILMLSAKTEKLHAAAQALDSGADDYMKKPISLEEFRARIHALLRRPEPQLSTELTHNELRMLPQSHELFFKDQPIHLTAKEYVILEYFFRNPKQVLTREQITQHVWDFSFESGSNVVDVHVKNIRKKLAKHGCNDYLKTIRGVGYEL